MSLRNLALLSCLALCPSAALLAAPISSFETADSLKAFSFNGLTVERVKEHATEGQWALKVLFPGSLKDTWPGITIKPTDDTTKHHALVFDVYNPSAEPAPLAWRIDPVGAKEGTFGSESIPGKASTRVEIWIRGMGPIANIYPYIGRPRKDYTLYFDNFRWEEINLYFTPLRFVDDTPPPAPTDQETRQGFIAYQRPLTDVVFANSVPRAEERTTGLDVFATPGQVEATTLALFALRDLKQARVSFEGLPAGGEVLPIRYRDKRVTYAAKEFVAGMPVLCERRAEIDVPRGSSQRFLLDLHISPDAKAGVYDGRVRVESESAAPISLPLRLRVLPYKLLEPATMYWGEYYTGPQLTKTDAEKPAFLRRDMTDMRAHGMTSVGLCFGAPTEKVSFKPDGSCDLGLDGTSLYEDFMNLYVELKYPAPVVLLSDMGQAAASTGKDAPAVDTKAWADRYQAYWRAMQAEARRRGWPEVIVQPVDEPGWQSRAEKETNVRCLKLLKQIPGLRTEEDGPGDNYFHNEAGPFCDLWNYNGALAQPTVVSKAIAAGKTILIYNCDVESYRPETDRYTAGWFQVANGISGCFNWAYICFSADPYDDQSAKMGTWMHVYPPLGNEPGGPSTGWVGAREGVDDFKYVYTLRETIKRAEASGKEPAKAAAQAARTEIAGVVASLDLSPTVRSAPDWTRKGKAPDGSRTIGGTLKQPNGWTHAEYEKARWRIARATLAILEALGEIPAAVLGTEAGADSAPLLTDLHWEQTAAPSAPKLTGAGERQVTIPVWASGPKLDGDLSDDVWQKAAKLDAFTLMSGQGAPTQATDVLVGADGANLYIGATCHEDNIAHLTANVTQDGGNVWEDDCIEVFVDGKLDRASFRQVVTNSLGVQSWHSQPEGQWRANSRSAAKVGDKAWTVELAIPLADLGLTGGQFGFNVCRERRPLESLELSCWSPTGEGFGVPDRFGLASLGQAWIGAMHVPPAAIGTNSFGVTLKNETDKPRTVACVLDMKWKDTEKQAILGQATALAPGQSLPMAYQYELPSAEAPTMIFKVLDPAAHEGKQALAERTFRPTVLAPLKMTLHPRLYYLSEDAGTVELEVHLAPALRESARLRLTLRDPEGRRVLREAAVSPIKGDLFQARLNLSGLPEGSYELRATLTTADRQRLATAAASLRRLRGPFD